MKMKSRRRRSNTDIFCDRQESAMPAVQNAAVARKSRSRSHGDLEEGSFGMAHFNTLCDKYGEIGKGNGKTCSESSSSSRALVYGKKVIQGEGIYEVHIYALLFHTKLI